MKSHPPRTLAHHVGFTLLEILLGMSLLSVMMLLLFGSLRICVQNWDAGETKLAQVDQTALIQNFFSNHLQNCLPLNDNFAEKPQFSFQGDSHAVQFVSTMPASAGRLGLQLFTVAQEETKSDTISVSLRPFFPAVEGNAWQTEQVTILKAVKSLNFEYFGVDDEKPGEPPVWQTTWLEKQQLPLLVKIVVELLDGQVWPEIIVALKIDNSSVMMNPFGIVNGRFTN